MKEKGRIYQCHIVLTILVVIVTTTSNYQVLECWISNQFCCYLIPVLVIHVIIELNFCLVVFSYFRLFIFKVQIFIILLLFNKDWNRSFRHINLIFFSNLSYFCLFQAWSGWILSIKSFPESVVVKIVSVLMTFKATFGSKYFLSQWFRCQEWNADIDDCDTQIDNINSLESCSNIIVNSKVPQ